MWSYRYWGLPGLYPTPEELVHGKIFADKDNVIASFISSSYYESFMQVLEALFHAFVGKKSTVAQGNQTLGKALLPCSLLLREQH